MFEREIEIHRTLNHENIVKCFDVFKTSTHIFMVLEYCPHGDLGSLLRQNRNINESGTVDIMTQILTAYKYLIKEGILHRDLKPANILRSGKIWKISDFGFSVRADSLIDCFNVGTPLYMPP